MSEDEQLKEFNEALEKGREVVLRSDVLKTNEKVGVALLPNNSRCLPT
jgi:hypothetical protein